MTPTYLCWHHALMVTSRKKPPARKKAVQVSLDQLLVKQVDAEDETKRLGRSAFITQAILSYLRQKRSQEVDDRLTAAYAGKADELRAEAELWISEQVWPPEDDLVETVTLEPPRSRARRGGR